MDIAAPGADALDSGGYWVLRVCLYRGGQDWGWPKLGLLSFIFLTGGIGPGVRHLLYIATPQVGVLAGGGAYFFCQGLD